jgi:LuxR family maltose regulon positive regulatory protein
VLSPLLATKLYLPPARSNRVPRPRLIQQLNILRPLTLIAAPAGFGKTTLVSEWIPQSSHCVTWLSLDEDDNDPIRFWAYVVAALQKLRADLGEGALALLQSPQPPPIPSILSTLINEISSFPENFSIVLDDYHLIKTQAIHEALTFLLDHLPPQMHIILTTRADPPLPLARLRARDRLTELRADNLRFTRDEAALFLNEVMGLKLTAEDIAALESRTEGWVAGLQLAALSMQGREDVTGFIQAFSGSHRHVLTYLAEEVLEQRPEGTLNFLLQTSILDRLCGPLCDTVTGENDSQALLQKLEQANLFIVPLDDEGKWFRYHHLFAGVLRGRLKQIQPDPTPELHRRASEWFEQSGVTAEAIEYALRGRDWSHAIRLIEANMQGAQQRGEIATVLRWLASLPDEAIQIRPTLGLAHARLLVLVDDFNTAESRLTAAEEALQSDHALDPATQSALLGQVAGVREVSALLMGYPGEAILAAGYEALRLLPESDQARRGYALFIMGCAHYLQLGNVQSAESAFQDALRLTQTAGDAFSQLQIHSHLSQMHAVQGRLRAAEMSCEDLLQLAFQPGWERVPAAGFSRIMHGRILYERNNLPGALEALTTGIMEVERYTLARPAIVGYILLARVKLALGDPGEARELLKRAWAAIQKKRLKQITIPASAYRARILLALGDLATALEWAHEIEKTISDPLNPALEYDHMSLARVWLKQERLAEARQLLERLLPLAEQAGRMGRVIELLALQVMVNLAQKEEAEALATLERALTLAEPEDYIRVFVDEGEAMRELVSAFRAKKGNHPLRAYVEKLLAAFDAPPATSTSAGNPQSVNQNLVDPLTARELEVLRLIAEGLSNDAIAQKLFLSIGTVKVHLKHIYGKLDVNSRTQAVARLRELNL